MTTRTLWKNRAMLAAALALVAANASAQCSFAPDLNNLDSKLKSLYNTHVSETDNDNLKSAYKAGNCQITKLGHGGGQTCPKSNLKITSHLTVKDQQHNKTCHVLDVKVNKARCTTCK